MKKTITNGEIVSILNVLNGQNSFTTNTEVKVPNAVRWPLKVNLKTLSTRAELINEEINEIRQAYFADGNKIETVTNDEGQDTQVVKPEYVQEFNTLMNGKIPDIMTQNNELDFEPITKKAYETFCNSTDGLISIPEYDALEYFLDDKEEEETCTE